MYTLVLIRHGESFWNLENRFTGWADVDLTPKGVEQARRAGLLLKDAGFEFSMAYTSLLKRAIHTLWPERIAGASASFQKGMTRSTVSLRLSVKGA